MKKNILILFLLCSILLCGCNNKYLAEDQYCKSKTESLLQNTLLGDSVSLDNICDIEWDYYIIDSSYNFLFALKELKIENIKSIDNIPLQDNICIIAFIKSNNVVSYFKIVIKKNDCSSYLENYLFQDNFETYRKGTLLEYKK